MQKNDFDNASIAYLNQLKYLQERPDQFKAFARYYQLLEKKASANVINSFRKIIFDAVEGEEIKPVIKEKLISFLGGEFLQDQQTIELLKLLDDDRNLLEIKDCIDDSRDVELVRILINYRVKV